MKMNIGGKLSIGGKIGGGTPVKKVTYHVDTNVSYVEGVIYHKTILSPKTFIPQKEGWTFVGWRTDVGAVEIVETEKIIELSDIDLYAVFKRELTLSYNITTGTSSAPEDQHGIQYYNNGNLSHVDFMLSEGTTKTNYAFMGWAENSETGKVYNGNDSISILEDTVMYATWKQSYFDTKNTSFYKVAQTGADATSYGGGERDGCSGDGGSGWSLNPPRIYVWFDCAYGSGSVTLYSNQTYDLKGFTKAKFTVQFDSNSNGMNCATTIGFVGATTNIGSVGASSATTTVEVDISALDSGQIYFYHKRSLNINHGVSRNVGATLKSITLS